MLLTRGEEHRKVHVQRDEDGRIIPTAPGTGVEDDEDQADDIDDDKAGKAARAAVESALLRFATPRDPATIAAFLRTRVYRPELLVCLEGYQALRRWREENGITDLYAVPYDTEAPLAGGETKTFPLGRWVHQQRKNLRAGTLEPHWKEQLDAEGMVGEPGDEAWETKLAALGSYRRAYGYLAPRQDAVQLAAIDEDWNCSWPLGWQRHHRVLARLAAGEPDGRLPAIAPGVVHDGGDLGTWITRQRRAWPKLSGEQRTRLIALGITPPATDTVSPPAPGAAKGKLSAPFLRGVEALARFTTREGTGAAPARGHIERLLDDGEEHEHKLGIWYAGTAPTSTPPSAPRSPTSASPGPESLRQAPSCTQDPRPAGRGFAVRFPVPACPGGGPMRLVGRFDPVPQLSAAGSGPV